MCADTQTHIHTDEYSNTSGAVGIVNAVGPREFEGARKMLNRLVKLAPRKRLVAKILCACIHHFRVTTSAGEGVQDD